MNIDITGHHIDITDSMRNYVSTKFERLKRHFDNVTDTHVILTVEKLRQKAEATIHIKGHNVFAEAVNEDMYAAIDSLTDKLDRQIKKHKEKDSNHHRATGGLKNQPLQVEE